MTIELPTREIGLPIPNISHAVSVSLPTWEATVGYEENQEWVVNKMNSGYPRFFIHERIKELSLLLEQKYGRQGEKSFIFPSYKVAKRCRNFIKEQSENKNLKCSSIRILQLSTKAPQNKNEESVIVETNIAVLFFPEDEYKYAKQYWQHSGEGISSRQGEYCLRELSLEFSKEEEAIFGQEEEKDKDKDNDNDNQEENKFIEERFGRNLDLSFAKEANSILRKRISAQINEIIESEKKFSKNIEVKDEEFISENEVYLYSSGMASIFHAHQAILNCYPQGKSICFGFPYVDTLSILRKFGPGVLFYGFGDDKSLDEMEDKLDKGEIKIMALFCECPSNPLLKMPDLKRIKKLAKKHDFLVVADETVGNFLNIHILSFVDICVSSLTKIFSGDSNVMAGSLVLNPAGDNYLRLKKYFEENYENNFWCEDCIYLERNSRNFKERNFNMNKNAESIVELLKEDELIKEIYYPNLVESKRYYEEFRTYSGGYGGLVSIIFKKSEDAKKFFNEVELFKGPSLGTNFSLACPYSILAHYQELDEIEKWGVDRNLVRISIGLEDKEELISRFERALEITRKVSATK
ncbi:cystathionine gamma-synthase [Ascoidea rubescens DSM 1968]|uniref:Cystathionine gamma-synthase n=1 Tax=Ascoidea rubescens DSM 1968 TaxID=1344418 RepID=A0A1D2VPL2_9ASCO|nr:cystathionine gamma-synthase [Ascoidea rubescens DSM 1968]ODV63562.1 cystathionine gamma-synthase [Ascoidea rubescens DSM 1968]